MRYKVLPTKNFEKDFKKLDFSVQKIIKKKIEEVAMNPTRYKHLHHSLNESCRIWIGKWRIIFSYNLEDKELYLEKVIFGHRY